MLNIIIESFSHQCTQHFSLHLSYLMYQASPPYQLCAPTRPVQIKADVASPLIQANPATVISPPLQGQDAKMVN